MLGDLQQRRARGHGLGGEELAAAQRPGGQQHLRHLGLVLREREREVDRQTVFHWTVTRRPKFSVTDRQVEAAEAAVAPGAPIKNVLISSIVASWLAAEAVAPDAPIKNS